MKNLFTLCFVVLFVLTNIAQQFETSILPDSILVNEPFEFSSNDETVFAVAYSESHVFGTYYLTKTTDAGTAYISDIPYPIVKENNPGESNWYLSSNTYAMEIFDGDLYHLTKENGIHIYKEDGSWETLQVDEISEFSAYSILKSNEKIYLIADETFYYFDGSTWSNFDFANSVKYAKIKEHNNLIYFNGADGLYRFDGTTIEQFIEGYNYSDFEIFNDKVWFGQPTGSNNYDPISVFDINGNNIDLDFTVTINEKTTFSILNDKIYLLNETNSGNLGFVIYDNKVSQVQENFINDYKLNNPTKANVQKYNSGIILVAENNQLINISPMAYDAFGSIQPGNNFRNLDINQVDAGYWNRGQMFWDMIATPLYEVPKGSGKTSLFAGGLWMSALDINDGIHGAVAKFNSNGHDYFPGPLKANGMSQGTSDSTYALGFDHIWKITREEIILHQLNYESNNYTMPEDIENWPAHGNTEEGYAEDLAPFVDINENGIYEPTMGDYPDIKGDMSLYWIFNDNLDIHHESEGSVALQVEVHAQAYAYTCDTLTGIDTALNYTTFLEYKVINRSTYSYYGFSSGFWTDADLGYASDDYFGTHVGLNSMYFYNGDDQDGTGNGNEYGLNPPAQFITILDAPMAQMGDGIDNDNDGTIDEEGEKSLLSNSIYFSNNNSAQGDPSTSADYFNYLNGIWRDGRPLVFGGTGYSPSGGTNAKYMFPGESDPWMNGTFGVEPDYTIAGGWTEENEANAPDDRRGLAVSGNFDFAPNQELNFSLAFVWSRGDDGAFSSVTKGFADVERITEMYNNGELHGCGLAEVSVNEIDELNDLEVFPNPVTDVFVVKGADLNSKYEIINLKGQLIKTGSLEKETINIKNLDEGTYVLRILEQNNAKVLKIVKI